jgi:ABC-type polysaccharide/polyol phosphate transport system ATPase subunit
VPDAPLAIQVEDLHKSFRIPTHRVDSLKERVVRPFSARDYRELRALDGISFEIHQGEFFGIVGRNGSGKSTLLKLLASIYRPDSGRILMAGRLAPFIELGVGFNVELTARENVVLNGVMMGLTPRETRARLDAIVEFAELGEFIDLKLKNYSSGMLVRLAFSLMMEVDADILLIDEVLAVGDASFQQKCADAFREMKAAGKTIVLVTHEMTTVEEYCHRAMLISDGRIEHFGDPAEVGRHYMRLNFDQGSEVDASEAEIELESDDVEFLDGWVENLAGKRIDSVEHGERIRLQVQLAAKRDLPGIDVGFILVNADGVSIAQCGIPINELQGPGALLAGQPVTVTAEIDNPLASGRYFVHCGINVAFTGAISLFVSKAIDFLVFGGPETSGVVSLQHEISAELGAEPA